MTDRIEELRKLLAGRWAEPWAIKDRGPQHDFDEAFVLDGKGKRVARFEDYDAALAAVAAVNTLPDLLELWEAARVAVFPLADFAKAGRMSVGLDGDAATIIRLRSVLDRLEGNPR